MAAAKTCLRSYYYSYGLGIERDWESGPLRFGGLVHYGLDLLAQGAPIRIVCAEIRSEAVPEWVIADKDVNNWLALNEAACQALIGYLEYYGADQATTVATEYEFDLPIRNPLTNRMSRNHRVAGKIDKIVRLPDRQRAVRETKTTSEDISPGSDWWNCLLIDQQISLYVFAARQDHIIDTVQYDVIRRPQQSLSQVPVLDAEGKKIVEDENGKRVFKKNAEPRLSPDSKLGWRLKTRTETVAEFGLRVACDIKARPDYYYVRQEIPRLQADLDQFEAEMWQIQQLISSCERLGWWFRNTSACRKPYRCDFCDICFQGYDPVKLLPPGYRHKDKIHTELEGARHDDEVPTEGAAAPTAVAGG